MCDSEAHLASRKRGDPHMPSVWALRHSKSADDFFMGWRVAVAAGDRGGHILLRPAGFTAMWPTQFTQASS